MKALLDDDQFKPKDQAAAGALIPVKVTRPPNMPMLNSMVFSTENAGSEIKMPAGLHVVNVSLPGYENLVQESPCARRFDDGCHSLEEGR